MLPSTHSLHDALPIFAVIRDMTEERKSDKLRKDFVANVSHELRTPLSLMQGYSEAIIDDVAETKEDKNELAKIIHDEAMRMRSEEHTSELQSRGHLVCCRQPIPYTTLFRSLLSFVI